MSGHPLPPRRVRVAAARWLVERRGGDADEAAFDAWIADPVHAEAYARMARHFELSGGVARRPPAGRTRPAAPGAVVALALSLLLGSEPAARTAVGEQRPLALADGSRMVLDTATRVVPVFDAAARRVRLTAGRARFDVAHGDPRPFIVEAGDMQVRAIGTRFDVRLEGARAEVILLAGRIEVSLPAARRRLVPGQALRAVGRDLAAAPADLGAARAWPDGRLVFTGAPLGTVVAEMNRYTTRPLVLADPALAAQPVTASFAADGRVEAARALAASLRLPLAEHLDRLVLGRAAKKS